MKRSTKQSLILSALSLLICASMLIGTTFAWFTDSVTSTGNKIQSGTLVLDLEMYDEDNTTADKYASIKDSKAPIFDYDKWEPGYTEVKLLKIENEGTLALKWYAKFVSGTSVDKLANIADVIDVYVCPSETVLSMPDRNLTGYKNVGTLRSFLNTIESTTYGILKPMGEAGDEAYLGIALKMQESAGNEYQDKTLGAFDIQILAAQLNYEPDSFDNTYDIPAEYEPSSPSTPVVNVFTAADLQAALTPTVSDTTAVVNLAADIQLADGETWTPLDINPYIGGTVNKVVINGNGHTVSGLNAPLFGDVHFGGTTVTVNNLTLKNSKVIEQKYNAGSGAFVAYADNCDGIVLNDCHLIDSEISISSDFSGGVGGLVGYCSSNLEIKDCSVTNTKIKGDYLSAGAIVGYVSGDDTNISNIVNAKVVGCTIDGENTNKSGYVAGTAGIGSTTITTKDCANNTVFGVANSDTIYGRFVPNGIGTLTVNGVAK
ncbi:MAG: hypothetical protein IJP16_05925 [Clostridia bacterium]|nr:hypothetical protein [Clostridia bacterium]